MKLILFTNLSRMAHIRKSLKDFGNNGQNIAIVHNNNIAFYDANQEVPENLQVILVNDNRAVGDNEHRAINNLIDGDNDIYVVYHKNTRHENTQKAIFNGMDYQYIYDSHIPGSIYAEISEWASKGCDPIALTQIIKKHFPDKKLGAVLDFLHQCLNDKIEDDYLNILKDAGIEVSDGDDSIKALFAKVKSPGKDTTKNQKLAALRDALLEKLGIV